MRDCSAPPTPPTRPGPGHPSPAGGALLQGRWAHSPEPAAGSGAGLGVGCPRGRTRRSRTAHLWAPRGRCASPPKSACGKVPDPLPTPSPNGERTPALSDPRAPGQAPGSLRTHRPIRGAHAPPPPPRRGAPAPPGRPPRPRPGRPASGPPPPGGLRSAGCPPPLRRLGN